MTAAGQSALLHGPLLDPMLRRSQAPAFIHGERVLSYATLAANARRGASALAARGIRPGDRLCLALGKGLDAVQLIFAGLMAGAVIVPLDPDAPPARLAAMVRDAGGRLLIATARVLERLGPVASNVPALALAAGKNLGEDPDDLLAEGTTPLGLPEIDPDASALFLYTSGSTGEPKAVVLSHGNVRAFIDWAIARLGIGAGDRLVSHAPFYFDLSTLDLYGAVRAGASTVLLDETDIRFPARITDILQRTGATVWYSVPTALVLLLHHGVLEQRDLSRLRLILFAGEPFAVPALRRLMQQLPHARYVNLYGPTETNVCTYHAMSGPPAEDCLSLPIGIPCEHLEVRILTADGSTAAPGETGEILVQGSAVMQGYWDRPGPTRAARWQGDPRSYLTGDLGYMDGSGRIHLIGRRDDQVKIRGHRVELAEVNGVLERQPGVAQAATLMLDSGQDSETGPRMLAAVVPEPGVTLDPKTLLAAARRWLPVYALPAEIRIMAELPRTPTGKVDKSTIRQRLASAHQQR